MIQKLFNKLYGSKNTNKTMMQNMMVLLTGTSIGKFIGILSIPIITRIYTPSDLGVLSVFIALSSILIPIGTLRYSVAIPLPKSDKIAINLAVVSFILLISISFIITIVLFFYSRSLFELTSSNILQPYWWLLSISILFVGIYEILSQWAIRKKEFKIIAKTNAIQSLSAETTKILLGILAIKPLGLVIGYIISQVGGTISLSKIFINDLKENFQKLSQKKMIFLLRYYKDFPKYRLPSQFLLIVSMQLPLLFTAWLFGTETTGQLGLALMALGLPIQLIGHSIGQAYYGEIAKIGKSNLKEIKIIAMQITKKLFYIAIIPTIVIFFYGVELFMLVFGKEWESAGKISSILVFYLLFQFISAPIVNTLTVLRKEKLFFVLNLRRIIFIISLFIFAYFKKLNLIDFIIIYSYIMALHYGLISYQIYRILNGK